jgi:sugar lactone lactonase YvrE
MSRPSLKSAQNAVARAAIPRLLVLELNAGRIHSMNTDGSDRKTIVSDCHLPDGIVVDTEAGHIYWTNMGIPSLNDGSVERADIDGKNRKVIVAKGVTHSPKQIILDKEGGKLYWCDREGMRVMRCNLDGSQLETLIETGRGEADQRDATRWCAISRSITSIAGSEVTNRASRVSSGILVHHNYLKWAAKNERLGGCLPFRRIRSDLDRSKCCEMSEGS